MAKYQKYAEYKDSGVEWLGEIPSHWKVVKLSYKLRLLSGDGITAFDIEDTGTYPVFGGNGLRGFTEKYNCDGEYALVGRQGALCGNINVARGKFFATEHAVVVYPYEKFNLTYLSEFLRFMDLGQYSVSAAQPGIAVDRINALPIVIPTLDEQNSIGDFLDHETSKIDHLIEKQQQLIELLKEKRQAVISHAVTKGLDPNVPMKDSGVEWLGEVPEHWVVKSYRLASRIYRGKFGHRPRNDPAFYDGDYPFIQTGDVARAGKYITSYSQTLNEKGKEVSQLFPKGTLMMAIAANIGDIAILGFEAYAPDSVVGFKPNNDIDLEFLRYSFIAALPALEQTSTQSTQANLNVERIGAVKGTFPSLQEQREIVGYLDNLLEQYRNLVKIAENAISLMQERRTALISAAVTGKIDVRHWQAPTLAEADTELSA